jgi:hypothetical protein
MALKDYIKDLTTYVTPTGFFDKIKVTAGAKDIVIEAMEKENKEVILKGKFSSPLAELDGEFGLSNLSLLQTITSDPEFSSADSVMTVTYETKNAEKIPTELAYQNKSKSYINYRFMSKQLVPEQPKFLEPKWDVIITPSKANIQQLAWAAAGLSSYEQYFIPRIVDGNLNFFIGEDDAATQRGGVVFASDRTETFDSPHKWKISQVMGVLKAADTCDCEMAFSLKGAIQITLNTGVGSYRYIFPAKSR